MGLPDSLKLLAAGESIRNLELTTKATSPPSELGMGMLCFYGGLTKTPSTSTICILMGKHWSGLAEMPINNKTIKL